MDDWLGWKQGLIGKTSRYRGKPMGSPLVFGFKPLLDELSHARVALFSEIGGRSGVIFFDKNGEILDNGISVGGDG